MKIGVIFCGYNCEDFVNECLSAWQEVKSPDFIYSCVSVPFEKFDNEPPDYTVEKIKNLNLMDFLFADSQARSEIEARGICLEFLKNQGCSIVWQVDLSDEKYSVENIKNIVEYVEKNPSFVWFKIALKNYVFDKKTYLKEPFYPPRIFRVSAPPYSLGTFRDDNSCTYFYQNAEIPDLFVKNKQIPTSVAWVYHFSWSDVTRSLKKINYQTSRNWVCDYAHNQEKNKIEFNPAAFKNKKLPEIITENE